MSKEMSGELDKPYDPIQMVKDVFYGKVMEAFLEIAKIYVKAIDKDRAWREKFREAFPNCNWTDYEEVGRGTMCFDLLLEPNHRNIPAIRKLPMSVQKEVVAGEKFDFLLAPGEGVNPDDHRKVDVLQVTGVQARQLFNGGRIRSLAEQKVWIREQKKPARKPEIEQMGFRLADRKCEILIPTILDIPRLEQILAELRRQ